eukprot:scaffold2929_cov107-Cylindrotheca_fusiformis.AAC.2
MKPHVDGMTLQYWLPARNTTYFTSFRIPQEKTLRVHHYCTSYLLVIRTKFLDGSFGIGSWRMQKGGTVPFASSRCEDHIAFLSRISLCGGCRDEQNIQVKLPLQEEFADVAILVLLIHQSAPHAVTGLSNQGISAMRLKVRKIHYVSLHS